MPRDPNDEEEPTFGDFLAQMSPEAKERLKKLNDGDTADYIEVDIDVGIRFDVEAAKAAAACQRRDPS